MQFVGVIECFMSVKCPKKEKMSKETSQLCEDRRELRKKLITAPQDRSLQEKYKEANRKAKASVKSEKRKLLEHKIIKMENDFQNNKTTIYSKKCVNLANRRW